MAKKLILVEFSARVSVEVPDGITDEQILDADEARACLSPEMEKVITTSLQEAYSAITNWRDGMIVDIMPDMPDELPEE